MTLNANFSGARLMSGRLKLEGPERVLDALIGLVILLSELFVGFLAVYTLYLYGLENAGNAVAFEGIQVGFLVALIGGASFFGITTITYLTRIVQGRRSWTAPLWGLILMSVSIVIGYLIMTSGL